MGQGWNIGYGVQGVEGRTTGSNGGTGKDDDRALINAPNT